MVEREQQTESALGAYSNHRAKFHHGRIPVFPDMTFPLPTPLSERNICRVKSY